jgi:hypothetical protein
MKNLLTNKTKIKFKWKAKNQFLTKNGIFNIKKNKNLKI